MYKFSIIIAAYNSEKYLSPCIDSCLDQSYENIEVICVNDASTDKSLAIMDKYKSKDSRFRYISHTENKSQYIARQSGVHLATGDYVMFLDSDDTLAIHACRIINNSLITSPVDILQFGYMEVPGGKKVYSPAIASSEEKISAYLSFKKRYSPEVWTKAYRADVLRQAFSRMKFFYSTLAEDLYTSVVITHNAKSFGYLHRPLVLYSVGSGSTTKKSSDFKILEGNLKSYNKVIVSLREYITEYCPEYIQLTISAEEFLLEDFLRNRMGAESVSDGIALIKLLPVYFSEDSIFGYFKIIQKKAGKYDYYNQKNISIKAKTVRMLKYVNNAMKGRNDL